MRVLIVNTNRERLPFPLPPIGAATIASAAQEAGHEVELLDLCFVRDPLASLKRGIRAFDPEVIGLSVRNVDNASWLTSVFYLEEVRGYVRLSKEVGRCPVVVGGAALGVLPAEVTAFLDADAGIWGDGEAAFVAFLARVAEGRGFADLPGLAVKNEKGQMQVHDQHLMVMDRVPSHRLWDWLDLTPYLNHSAAVPIQTRRGCTFRCVYCTYRRIEGKSYRCKPISQVVEEIAQVGARLPGVPIEFVDSTFNVPLDYTIDLCRALEKARLGVPLHTAGFNPGAVNEALFDAMEAAGFAHVVVTPESASDTQLRNLQKGFGRAHVEKVAMLRKRVSFAWFWVFLLGGPGETEDTLSETFDFIEGQIPKGDLVFIQTGMRVYPHTALEKIAREEGVINPSNNLLRPTYYISSKVAPERLRTRVLQHIARNPNSSTTRDLENPLIPVFHRLAGILNVRTPSSPMAARAMRMMASLGIR